MDGAPPYFHFGEFDGLPAPQHGLCSVVFTVKVAPDLCSVVLPLTHKPAVLKEL